MGRCRCLRWVEAAAKHHRHSSASAEDTWPFVCRISKSQRQKKCGIYGEDFIVGREAQASPEKDPDEVLEKSEDTLPTGGDFIEPASGSQEAEDDDPGIRLLCNMLSQHMYEDRERLNRLEYMLGKVLSRQRQLESLIRQQPNALTSVDSTVIQNPVKKPLRTASDFRKLNPQLKDDKFRQDLITYLNGLGGSKLDDFVKWIFAAVFDT